MAVYDWHARADKRDEEARKKADISAIDRTAKTLKDHMQAGELLRQRGVERLVAKPISDEKTAVSAIKLGVELERQALGLPNDVGQQQLEVNVAGQVDINEAALLAAIERLLDDEDALRKANAAPEEGKAIEGTG
jgi:pyridoxal/pyridoxine/pyridoxamine kinase